MVKIKGDLSTREYTADELEFNDRGWLLNEDTKRINVVSSNNDIDISINGKPIIVRGDQLFVTDSNGCEEYVGMTCTFNENGETLFTLIDDDYDIQIDSDTDSIRVEYVDAGYYEKVVFLIIMTAAIAVLLAFGFWGEDGFFRGELIAASFLMIADCFALIGIGIAHLVYYIVKNKK